jgi:HlyD family secretion protein
VYVLEQGEPSARDIETGVSDGSRTEVVSGDLREGTEVIVDAVEPSK